VGPHLHNVPLGCEAHPQLVLRDPAPLRQPPVGEPGRARIAIQQIEKLRDCHYPELERAMPELAPRALFMIHGGGDNYIKPDMAKALFALAREPRELWIVDKAKHNQAIHLAADEYKRRVLAFFDRHLAEQSTFHPNGVHLKEAAAKEQTAI
jgi:hypothetical protein